jgi:hypothetical protein
MIQSIHTAADIKMDFRRAYMSCLDVECWTKRNSSLTLQTIAITHREMGDPNNVADAIHAISDHLEDPAS